MNLTDKKFISESQKNGKISISKLLSKLFEENQNANIKLNKNISKTKRKENSKVKKNIIFHFKYILRKISKLIQIQQYFL